MYGTIPTHISTANIASCAPGAWLKRAPPETKPEAATACHDLQTLAVPEPNLALTKQRPTAAA